MSRVKPAASSEGERRSLYEEITGQIIAELEAGRIPWVQPWGRIEDGPSLGMPLNAATGRRYSGINILILWGAVFARGYASQAWLTFRQAQALGGSVRRGERGVTVVYADRFTPQEERRRASEGGDEARSIAFLKRFTVFSVEQCDGLPDELIAAAPIAEVSCLLPEVEALIRRSCADMRLGGDRAFYAPTLDYIQVPRPEAFFDPVNWHRTALHELGHWSGASHRLARDLTGRFGSVQYAREELVAEMSAAFTCASLGVTPTVRHADYIGDWLQVLRDDDRAIVRAASAASKAADYLLAFREGTDGRA